MTARCRGCGHILRRPSPDGLGPVCRRRVTPSPTRPATGGHAPTHTPAQLPLEDHMTDRPYTDEDLRAEAARQHATLTEDPDFMGVGERMDGAEIESLLAPEEAEGSEGAHWDDLNEDDFELAQNHITDLINGAADVSAWAVNLGADALEPAEHTLQLGVQEGEDGEDKPQIRLHFAFAHEMPDEDRDRFVMELGKVVLRNL